MFHSFAIFLLSALLSSNLPQRPSADQEIPVRSAVRTPLRVTGFIDLYYAVNSNHPRDRENFFPGTGTTAKTANRAGLNLAAVIVGAPPEPLGFNLVLNAGDGTDVVHSGEPHSAALGRDALRAVYQASISYRAGIGRGLLLEAGVFPSHIGFEGYFSKDNWNYTRSWAGEFSPYYQAGVKLSYPFTSHFSGQLHILNGWQLVLDNNHARCVGTQLLWDTPRLTVALNTLFGPELAGDNRSLRGFADLYVVMRPTERWSFAGFVDRGSQEFPHLPSGNWMGVGAYLRYASSSRHALAVRAEVFDDPHGAITGAAQKLTETTLTYEQRLGRDIILKIEARTDRSTAPVFAADATETKRSQRLLVLGLVATF